MLVHLREKRCLFLSKDMDSLSIQSRTGNIINYWALWKGINTQGDA